MSRTPNLTGISVDATRISFSSSIVSRSRRSSAGFVRRSSAVSGAVIYFHIPATDARGSAAFYRDVVGWSIDRPDSDRPSFEDAGGLPGGASRASGRGRLPSSTSRTSSWPSHRSSRNGGAILTEPAPEGLLTVARFRDPEGQRDRTLARHRPYARVLPARCLEQRFGVAAVPEYLHTGSAYAAAMLTGAPGVRRTTHGRHRRSRTDWRHASLAASDVANAPARSNACARFDPDEARASSRDLISRDGCRSRAYERPAIRALP